jgi:hypothetical protein
MGQKAAEFFTSNKPVQFGADNAEITVVALKTEESVL